MKNLIDKRLHVSNYMFDDAVTHVTLPGHFPRPGPDLGGARGIATGVAGGGVP